MNIWVLPTCCAVHTGDSAGKEAEAGRERELADKLTKVWLPWWLSGKESACNVGDSGLIPGLGRFSGKRHGNPLLYSYLENTMDRGAFYFPFLLRSSKMLVLGGAEGIRWQWPGKSWTGNPRT